MKRLSIGPAARPDRAASELVHDDPDVRVVAFHLQPGQEIKSHRSKSTVLVQVTAGRGRFIGEECAEELATGESAVFAPGEPHAIEALDEPLRFLAVITPGPGA